MTDAAIPYDTKAERQLALRRCGDGEGDAVLAAAGPWASPRIGRVTTDLAQGRQPWNYGSNARFPAASQYLRNLHLL